MRAIKKRRNCGVFYYLGKQELHTRLLLFARMAGSYRDLTASRKKSRR